MDKYKIGLLTSHPIEDQIPLFQEIKRNNRINLTVFFAYNKELDKEFGNNDKLPRVQYQDVDHKFLKNYSIWPSLSFFGLFNPRIILELFKNKFDALIVHGYAHATDWLAFFGAYVSRTPIFLRGESPLNQELLKPKSLIFFKRFLLGKILFPRVSRFLYIGEENKKFYKFYNVPEEKLYFVPYAINNEKLIKKRKLLIPQRSILRKKLNIQEKDTVILFVGKLIDKKKPMDLLKAFETLIKMRKATTNGVHLIFVGSGTEQPHLKRMIIEHDIPNTHLVGFKNQKEIIEYYALSDIFVLPSGPGETWGLVVNEAMCFGLAVIVSDIVGCGSDLVFHNKNGFITKLGDVNQLANYLNRLIGDKNKITRFSNYSLGVIERYTYQNDVQGIQLALRSLNTERLKVQIN